MAPDGRIDISLCQRRADAPVRHRPEEVESTDAPIAKQIHPDDLPRVVGPFDHSARTLTPRQCEVPDQVARDGVENWIFGHSVPEREPDGSIALVRISRSTSPNGSGRRRRIYDLAYFDPLTGLPNRTQLLDDLNEPQLHDARRTAPGAHSCSSTSTSSRCSTTPRAIIAGDQLLTEVADRLRSCTDRAALRGALGGDEFVILLSDLGTDRDAAEVKVRAVRRQCPRTARRPFDLDGSLFETTASVGVSLFRGGKAADEAAEAGRPRHVRSEGRRWRPDPFLRAARCRPSSSERLTLRRELRDAIGSGELTLVYQPQVDDDCRCFGAEALLRWRHPVRGDDQAG